MKAYYSQNKCTTIHDKVQGETDDLLLYTCLCQVVDKSAISYIQMYQSFKKGVMLHTGGYLEQNGVTIELLSMIGNILNEIESEEMKKLEKKKK